MVQFLHPSLSLVIVREVCAGQVEKKFGGVDVERHGVADAFAVGFD